STAWSTAMAPRYQSGARLCAQVVSVEHDYGAQLSTTDAGRPRGARLWHPVMYR
ncbi:hypothetical protein CBR_g88136, partial [Chara braunii]